MKKVLPTNDLQRPMRYLIRGSSIDGTVYSFAHGWVSDKRDAEIFGTLESAEERAKWHRERSAKADLDDKVGHVKVLETNMSPRPDPEHSRAFKRWARKRGMNNPVELAHSEGEWDRLTSRPYHNRYPKGYRHDAYKSAYGR